MVRFASPRSYVVAALALLSGSVLVVAWAPWSRADNVTVYTPNARQIEAEGSGQVIAGSLTQVRYLEDTANSVTWTIYAYATTVHADCFDAVATLSDTAEHLGVVGGCGLNWRYLQDEPEYVTGSVPLPDGGRSSITFGYLPAGVQQLVNEVTYTWENVQGELQRQVDPVVQGVWAFVFDTKAAAEQALVEMWGRLGQLIEDVAVLIPSCPVQMLCDPR